MPPSPQPNANKPLNTPLNVPQALAQALDLHRAGRLSDAERLYAAILAARPDHFDALQMMGLVNRVLPDAGDALEKYVKDYADIIAGNAPITVDSIKFIVGQVLKDPDRRDLKACEDWVSRAFASNDYHEGRKAFMEKRKPQFTGR